MANRFRILSVVLLCLTVVGAGARAQVLAQRGWAGSGVSVEPWWRRAVFYRIDPARFQDSREDYFEGAAQGDIAGVVKRLEYLQSLGVDAVILRPEAGEALTTDGFDDLARAATQSHVRVLVELGAPESQSADAQYLALARSWLNQGAAGLYIPTAALTKVDGTGHIAQLLHQLRLLTSSFPGERVLLADAAPTADQDLIAALRKETQLTASAPLGMAVNGVAPTAASLRAQLSATLGAGADADASPQASSAAPSAKAAEVSAANDKGARRRRGARARSAGPTTVANPLLEIARLHGLQADAGKDEVAARAALERTLALMLLGSRAAALIDYGQELGLDAAADGSSALMQWTPKNETTKPAPPAEPEKDDPAKKAAYQEFHAFVPPLPRDFFPPPKMPLVEESDNPQPVHTDPDSFPGFSGGTPDAALIAANGATANVAVEEQDAGSLLSLYRQLIRLHHDNPTVRNGTQTLLDHDAENVVSWVRRAPAGVRTSASVVFVGRLGAAGAGSAATSLDVTEGGTKVVRDLIGTNRDVVFVGEGR
jgi:hypothetical protein